MKHNLKILLVIAGIFVVPAVLLYSCGGGGGLGYSSGGGGGTPLPMATGTVQVVACPGTTAVSIVNMTTGFSPSSATVPVNTVVQWTNNDAIDHTVTSTSTVPSNIATFDSHNLAPGTSVCLKFISAGTYNYHCTIHPLTMIGAVTVQ